MTDRKLEQTIPTDRLVTDPIALSTFQFDGGLSHGQPDGVVIVENAQDVARVVGWANETGTPIIARGAGTGLSGGAVASRGGIVLEFARMNHIVHVDEPGRSVRVEPGVVNQTLDEFVKTKGLYFPADPASGRSCTLGGNIGENAGGPHCFKYGVTTNYITGLRVILADGRGASLGGQAFDYPEYDFVGLMTGSEGTLGLVVDADARLLRNPPAIKTLMVTFDSVEDAGNGVSALIAHGLVPATMEMMDQKIVRIVEDFVHAGLPTDAGALLIIEVDGYPSSLAPQADEIAALLRECKAREIRTAQNAAERDKIWYGRKSAIGALARLAPMYMLMDGTVPRSQLAATLSAVNQVCDELSLRVGFLLHAGDGNLHPLILIDDPDDPAVMERVHAAGGRILSLCVERGGTITGEHGVGIEKIKYMTLMHSAAELQAMREVKEVFDPKGILNPGKMFPPTDTVSQILNLELPVADAIRSWAAEGKSIRVRGGGTKSSLLPRTDLTLTTQTLCGIRAYSGDDLYVTVGAGTPLAELEAELARDKMWVPLISPWSESTVGGIVATNFNAPQRMRYGGIRDLVLAMTVVLPDGRVIRAGRPVVKNVAGSDMPKLFIGSRGTLGLIADVTFKVVPQPRARGCVIARADDWERGLAWGTRLLRVCLNASALVMERDATGRAKLVYTVEGTADDVTAELEEARSALFIAGATEVQFDRTISGNDLWREFLQVSAPGDTVLRVGVPPQELCRVLGCGLEAISGASFLVDFASGMVYARNAPDPARLREAALACGGYAIVLSAPPEQEFDTWGYVPETLELARTLKARWDPQGLFNPGAFVA